jgi:hypothetical protein
MPFDVVMELCFFFFRFDGDQPRPDGVEVLCSLCARRQSGPQAGVAVLDIVFGVTWRLAAP